jgi:hypothetical protein
MEPSLWKWVPLGVRVVKTTEEKRQANLANSKRWRARQQEAKAALRRRCLEQQWESEAVQDKAVPVEQDEDELKDLDGQDGVKHKEVRHEVLSVGLLSLDDDIISYVTAQVPWPRRVGFCTVLRRCCRPLHVIMESMKEKLIVGRARWRAEQAAITLAFHQEKMRKKHFAPALLDDATVLEREEYALRLSLVRFLHEAGVVHEVASRGRELAKLTDGGKALSLLLNEKLLVEHGFVCFASVLAEGQVGVGGARVRVPVYLGIPEANGCPESAIYPRGEIVTFVLSCLNRLGCMTATLNPHHAHVGYLDELVRMQEVSVVVELKE